MKRRLLVTVCMTAILMLSASISVHSKTKTAATGSPARATDAKKSGTPKLRQPAGEIYVVQKGDSLIRIARENGTTVQALKAANGLKNSKIAAGKKLVIPGSQSSTTAEVAPKKKENTTRNEELAAQYISQFRAKNQIADPESAPKRLQLVEAGFKMLGIRYRRSGGSEKTGFDCSGLVKSLFSQFNIELPRTSREQYNHGEEVDRSELEVGDLVFFSSGGNRPNHVGIYIGDNKFIHAAVKARRVVVSDLNKIWYTMRYLGARRIADLWWDEVEAPSGEE